jgi:hypothetical protein
MKIHGKPGFFLGGLLLVVFFGGFIYINVILHCPFAQQCEVHLQRAATAPTIELARQELAVAIEYLENNSLTTGYTSVFCNTPGDDIGYWYRNIKAAHLSLTNIANDVSQSDRTAVLLRLRQTLVDGDGDVILPGGIHKYPHNKIYFGILLVLALFGLLGTGLLVYAGSELDLNKAKG